MNSTSFFSDKIAFCQVTQHHMPDVITLLFSGLIHAKSPQKKFKTNQLSQNSITIYNTKFQDTVTVISIDVLILKTILFTLLQNTFRILLIHGHNLNNRSGAIHSNLKQMGS
jgi:hypothetical protein